MPGLDTPGAVKRSKLPAAHRPDARPRASARRSCVINARTGKRHLIWAELDSNADDRRQDRDAASSARRATSTRASATSSRCATSRTRAAATIKPQRAFRIYRDRIRPAPARSSAAASLERIFKALKQAGSARQLYLAWDFTVASERNLAGRVLHIRDDAFAPLGDTQPARPARSPARRPPFTIDTVTDLHGGRRTTASRARSRARSTVPCYLTHGVRARRQLHVRQAAACRGGTGTTTRQLRLPHPALGARPGHARPRRGRRSTATACSAAPSEVDAGNVQVDGERAQLRVLRDRLGGLRRRGHREHRRGRSATSRTSPPSPTACSRASSTCCYLGRLMIHPQRASAQRRVPEERPERDRHDAACSTTATARAGSWAAR